MRRLCAALALSLCLLAAARRAAAQAIDLPVRVAAGQVTVRAQAGLARVAARVARDAPGRLRALEDDLAGLPRPAAVEIRLVVNAEDLGRAAPPGRGAPPWAAGVAYPDAGVVVVAARHGADLIDVDRVVAHELAHMALGAALRGRAPHWLDEGFAYLHSADFSLARAQTLTGLAWSGNVIPLYELDASFPAGEDQAAVAYAESYDLVVFLARRGRWSNHDDDGDRAPFRKFLAEMAAHGDPYRAALAAYGVPLDQLFSEWYQDLRDRYLLYPVGLGGLLLWIAMAVLLVIGWLRRRVQRGRTLARWEVEEARAGGDGGDEGRDGDD